MRQLVIGLLLWSFMHFLPALAPGLRSKLITRLGENGYKASFGVFMFFGIIMMVRGWKLTGETVLYAAPEWGGILTLAAMLASSVLFFAPYMPNSLRRLLRHPQLTGVVLFGLGHLVAVGYVRSLVLFGGLSLWAVLEMVLINRRDGPRVLPEAATRKDDLKLLVAGLGFFMIFLFTHEALFGVGVLPE